MYSPVMLFKTQNSYQLVDTWVFLKFKMRWQICLNCLIFLPNSVKIKKFLKYIKIKIFKFYFILECLKHWEHFSSVLVCQIHFGKKTTKIRIVVCVYCCPHRCQSIVKVQYWHSCFSKWSLAGLPNLSNLSHLANTPNLHIN